MTIHLHRHIGQFLLSLTLLTVLAVVTGAWLDLGSQFYLGGFALIPFLLSAIVVYHSLLTARLPRASGYWLAPVCVLMAWSYLSLLFGQLSGQFQPDALGSLVWFTLPLGHGLLLLMAVALYLVCKPLINKYLK
jgi:hypothetical protein